MQSLSSDDRTSCKIVLRAFLNLSLNAETVMNISTVVTSFQVFLQDCFNLYCFAAPYSEIAIQ